MSALNSLNHPAFADIDRHFAAFISKSSNNETLSQIIATLSRAVRLGNICLDLAAPPAWEGEPPFAWPTLEAALAAVRQCNAVKEPGILAPLVLQGTRLYLRRYWDYEQSLACALKERADGGNLSSPSAEPQELAIQTALAKDLTIISGGPGTGKTTTAVEILANLSASSRIVLSAPTGKAAARLEEAVRNGFAKKGMAAPVTRASTLHRLLGSRPGSASVRHDARNPLALDCLIVDEASMVALPLMAKLFAALPAHAKVILLGDRDQLASVEPGSVLADIADAAAGGDSRLSDCFVTLTTNHRFGNDSAIYRLCQAVRSGDEATAITVLEQSGLPDLGCQPTPAEASLKEKLRAPVLEGYRPYLKESDPAAALKAFGQFRMLCAPRRGPYGVESVNELVAEILSEEGVIPDNRGDVYRGMPVLITRNDYQTGLFNGDIGIILPDPNERSSQLFAWFPSDDGSIRRIPCASLPDREPAYTMTVHKSQGSEFEKVLLLLPDRDTPILTRELIYTGLTRARTRIDVWTNRDIFCLGAARRTERASGLKEALLSQAGITAH